MFYISLNKTFILLIAVQIQAKTYFIIVNNFGAHKNMSLKTLAMQLWLVNIPCFVKFFIFILAIIQYIYKVWKTKPTSSPAYGRQGLSADGEVQEITVFSNIFRILICQRSPCSQSYESFDKHSVSRSKNA